MKARKLMALVLTGAMAVIDTAGGHGSKRSGIRQ